jgi:cell division protein ZapE
VSKTARPGSPLGRYQAGIAKGTWTDDPHQRKVLVELTRIHEEILARRRHGPWMRLMRRLRPEPPVRGLYVHGGVGRGKTFLMDLFFDGLPIQRKQRLHFHRFMGRVHADLATLKDVEDPLATVAEHFAEHARVLCFDEFFVADIGDAMLLGRLFKHLFANGVTVIATSNVAPKNLYKDGLQRAQFLPAIALIEKHCKVLHLDSTDDYRLRALTQAEVYHAPLDTAAQRALEDAYTRLSTATPDPRATLEVNGREIPVLRRAGTLVWFEFDALCRGPRAAADYIEIAQSFSTVIVSGIPVFTVETENEARRFIHLIDEFYDRSVKIMVSAAAGPTALYQGQRVAAEFARTSSRLIEMQSEAYLGREHHE